MYSVIQKRRNFMISMDLQLLKKALVLVVRTPVVRAASVVFMEDLAAIMVDSMNIILKAAIWMIWEIFSGTFLEICSMVRKAVDLAAEPMDLEAAEPA